MTFFDAFILGLVEGLTEFLPVSSTGHLILVSTLLGLKQTDFQKTFEVAIQLGSILAIVFLFHKRLFSDIELWKRIIVAFIPTGVLGFLLYKVIKGYLFSPFVVATMLILGGVIFILVELWLKNRKTSPIKDEDQIPYWKAFAIGLFQSLAMIPGTSRSGATIIGGLLLGLDRKTAAEFSFLLAVPTMLVATAYDVYKHHNEFSLENWQLLAVGFITAFISAYIVVKWFLDFIKKHSFIPFGVYRIIVGLLFWLVVLH
ncbi:MAG: undecaprenyl-diphosphate phosphatase [Aquificae bacterium]|nr:undecaprenyl-diphosphate phosphatase [Aquificota bacterium]